jgi:hypothetical protein
MLTNEFCVKGKFWEKDPHTHSPPPPSKCGRCVQHFHAPTYPFIDPFSPASWLGKGNRTTEELATR